MKKVLFSIIFALVMVFSLGSSASANSYYETVQITPADDWGVSTERVYASNGYIDYYIENNTGIAAIPTILSWSITDSEGNEVEGDSINPTKERVDQDRIYVSEGYYTLTLHGYIEAYGFGSLYTGV
ncbi:hypothetical protein EQV77_17505 [Halobacillus fulvus]|nr:hypothetical protein EQV77_17505 [Halobacillus fulvus]